jgi:hypothetical protein
LLFGGDCHQPALLSFDHGSNAVSEQRNASVWVTRLSQNPSTVVSESNDFTDLLRRAD